MKYLILTKISGIVEVEVKEYDDLTYYLSDKIKGNEHLRDVPGYSEKYMLIDKKTSLVVCSTLKQRDLKEKYESVKDLYDEHRNTKTYQSQIEEYVSKTGQI
jgi:hypothetical protein